MGSKTPLQLALVGLGKNNWKPSPEGAEAEAFLKFGSECEASQS